MTNPIDAPKPKWTADPVDPVDSTISMVTKEGAKPSETATPTGGPTETR